MTFAIASVDTALNVIAVKPNKGFGTGKGTTAKVRAFFENRPSGYWAASDIANTIDVPSRQLSKRLAELVKAKFLIVDRTFGINEYKLKG